MTSMMKAAIGLQVGLAASLIAGAAMASGAVVASPDKSTLYWALHKPNERIRPVNQAFSRCGDSFSSGCFLEKAFSRGCFAVARSESHHRWGYAVRPSEDAAREAAMGECRIPARTARPAVHNRELRGLKARPKAGAGALLEIGYTASVDRAVRTAVRRQRAAEAGRPLLTGPPTL